MTHQPLNKNACVNMQISVLKIILFFTAITHYSFKMPVPEKCDLDWNIVHIHIKIFGLHYYANCLGSQYLHIGLWLADWLEQIMMQ